MSAAREIPSDPSTEQPTSVRYLVVAAFCLAAAIAYIHRNSLSVIEKEIRLELGLSKEQMGLVMSAFFLTYAVLQLPTGWLGYVWGTRRSLPLFCAVWSVATGLTAFAGGIPLLLVSRLASGGAQAGMFPCATQSIAQWLPASRIGLASGALGSSMSVGAALGVMATGYFVAYIGWKMLFLLYTIPGLAFALLFYVWFRNRPEEHPSVNAAELRIIHQTLSQARGVAAGDDDEQMAEPATAPDRDASRDDDARTRAALSEEDQAEAKPERIPWGQILTSRAMLFICGQQFFRAAGYTFYASWFATYLKEARGVSTSEAGLLTSLPLWGVVLGSLSGGWISDWLLVRSGSRRIARQGLSIVSLAACAALILIAYPVEDVVLAVLIISLGSFFAAAAGPAAYTITIDMGGRHIPTVFSLMNMAGNIGAVAFPLVVPLLVGNGTAPAPSATSPAAAVAPADTAVPAADPLYIADAPALPSAGPSLTELSPLPPTEIDRESVATSAGATLTERANWDNVLFLFAALYAGSALCWLLLNPDGSIVNDVPEADDNQRLDAP